MPSLKEIIGHDFSDPSLIDEAVTHPSLATRKNYQRLEFLGDRVLALVVADWLFSHFPTEAEGRLNRRFVSLVRKETLAEIAEKAGLAEHIKMERTAEEDGGRNKPTVLADVCEAVIGAIYLDGGMAPARRFIDRYWKDRFDEGGRPRKDAKSALQEWAQARGMPTPIYVEKARTGPDHSPVFTMVARLEGVGEQEASGASKRLAEQAAATAFLSRLEAEAE